MPAAAPVSSTELASIQHDLAAIVCDQTALIYARASTKDAYGTTIDSWPTLTATTVCGLAQPTSTHLQNFDYMIGAEASWLVHFPIGTIVNEQDHVIVNSQTLEIHVDLTPQSYPGLLSVLAAEIK